MLIHNTPNIRQQVIRSAFNRASNTYHDAANIQNKICHDLIRLFLNNTSAHPIQYIADFGCGVGNSTQLIKTHINAEQYYGIDIAEKCLAQAQAQARTQAQTNIHWIQASFENTIFKEEYLDLAISNMGLHWSQHLPNTLQCIQKQLQPEGYLLFSIPLEGTYHILRKRYRHPFSTHERILRQLKDLEFHIHATEKYSYQQSCKDVYQALKHMKQTGTNISTRPKHLGLQTKNELKNFFIKQAIIRPALMYQVGIYLIQRQQPV